MQYTAVDFAGREWVFSQSIADVAPEGSAGVLAGWLAGVPRLRFPRGGEDAAWPAAGTAALR